jgi:cell division protein FtsI (penicillin-binding protein 3)
MAIDRASTPRSHDRGLLPTLSRRFTRLFSRTSNLDPLSDDGPDGRAERAWRPCIKHRTVLLLSALVLWTAAIEARLVWLQVVQHDYLVLQATEQQEDEIPLEPMRGQIVDRYGRLLAFSVEADSITADPLAIKADHKAETVNKLCDALGDCTAKDRAEFAERISQKKHWTLLRRSRTLSPDQVNRVTSLALPGILLEKGTRRYYPKADLAAHVLGFVSAENKGQAGVELARDGDVRGTLGKAVKLQDGRQQQLLTRVELPPVPGVSLELTIDLNLQHIAQRELRAAVEANHADGGTVIIMDPYTGRVLALANYPTFDPNTGGSASNAELPNRAVQTIYEPGSTFKIVTASAALEEGIVAPTDLIDTNPGVITFPGRTIEEAKHHNYGVLSFEDVIVKSSNVGAVKIGLKVGRELVTRYVERFGFGQRITRDLPAEIPGLWRPANLTESGLASVSMGYQIGVTPMQMAAAVNSVANGGILFEPQLVGATVRDGHREPIAPKALRRTISATTAATLTTMMEGVVERGTATAAQLDGYQVAGKTGTAHKAAGRGYSNTDFFASFVGFVPSRQPVFTILVVIDTPRAGTHFGGTVAAPAFKRIATAALQEVGVPSRINPIPPVIVGQIELPRQTRTATAVMVPVGGPAVMPDVRGLAAREATRVLSSVGVTVSSMTGAGVVIRQIPEPGVLVAGHSQGVIVLGRRFAEMAPASGGAW